MKNNLAEMLQSGELATLAQGCSTFTQIAKKMGITANALEKKIRRYRLSGRKFPTLEELQESKLTVQFDEEPTNPAVKRWPSVEAFDAQDAAPDGFHVTGVSTLIGRDGEILRWVKTARDAQDRMDALLASFMDLAADFRGLADPQPLPSFSDDDLLCGYPLGDPHIGMYSWAEETGQSFDLEIAERNLVTAMDHLVALAPAAKHALIANLGDFFHTDNSTNQTLRSHNALDVDTRWSKVLGVGVKAMRRLIDSALKKHEHVTVVNAIGNHDDHSAIFLSIALQQFYEREPRVHIDPSPAKFHWYHFGKNLIGITHTDTVKPQALPGIMAHDRADIWSATKHRYWWGGHRHQDIFMEFPGVTFEGFCTLAARDAWANAAGYRSRQNAKCIVLHREHGEVLRHTVGINQVCHG